MGGYSKACVRFQAWRTRSKRRLRSLRRVQESKAALVAGSWRSREICASNLLFPMHVGIQSKHQGCRRSLEAESVLNIPIVLCTMCWVSYRWKTLESPFTAPCLGVSCQWCLECLLCHFWLQSLDIRSLLFMAHILHQGTIFLFRKDFAVGLIVKYSLVKFLGALTYLLSLEIALWW